MVVEKGSESGFSWIRMAQKDRIWIRNTAPSNTNSPKNTYYRPYHSIPVKHGQTLKDFIYYIKEEK